MSELAGPGAVGPPGGVLAGPLCIRPSGKGSHCPACLLFRQASASRALIPHESWVSSPFQLPAHVHTRWWQVLLQDLPHGSRAGLTPGPATRVTWEPAEGSRRPLASIFAKAIPDLVTYRPKVLSILLLIPYPKTHPAWGQEPRGVTRVQGLMVGCPKQQFRVGPELLPVLPWHATACRAYCRTPALARVAEPAFLLLASLVSLLWSLLPSVFDL